MKTAVKISAFVIVGVMGVASVLLHIVMTPLVYLKNGNSLKFRLLDVKRQLKELISDIK